MLALHTFSTDITSYSHGAQLEWPLVTVPDFHIRGMAARQQMKADAIGLLPLVTLGNRERWETYASENYGWIHEAKKWEMERQAKPHATTRHLRGAWLDSPKKWEALYNDQYFAEDRKLTEGQISERIFKITPDGKEVVDNGSGPFTPIWMTSPAPPTVSNINFNLLSHQYIWQEIEIAIESRHAVISKVLNVAKHQESITSAELAPIDPVSAIYYPIFDSYSDDRALVGLLASEIKWTHLFEGALPTTASGLICVIENACGQSFSFRVDGPKATYLGPGDLHDPLFNDMVVSRSISYLADLNEDFAGTKLNFQPCPFALHIYPSAAMQDSYETNGPIIFASAVLGLFFISAGIFFMYDNIASRVARDDRSVVVLERLFQGGEIKASITDRIMTTISKARPGQDYTPSVAPAHFKATIQALPGFRNDSKTDDENISEATVLFADIYGLDAWSAGKESKERSNLLQIVHRTFNLVAKRYGVAHVEMSGDCFVAIKGSRDVQDDHAVILSCFACDCRKKLNEKFKGLDAKGLAIRFGMHSGHVQTGGMFEHTSRYQLLGDTIDTTYQMLKSSRAGKIHVSVETAELLNLAGRGDWLAPRSDLVLVKDKGEMSTFWIKPKACLASCEPPDLLSGSDASTVASEASFDDVTAWENLNLSEFQSHDTKFHAVVDRTVDLFLPYLKKIQAKRNALKAVSDNTYQGQNDELPMGDPIMEEAREVVRMPAFDHRIASAMTNYDYVDLSEEVESQLRLYVSSIVSTYRDNEFHNVEHAAHVTLTMDKLIKKLSSPEKQDVYIDFGGKPRSTESIAYDLDGRTFGIASDPVTQFALLFSSLVHDVDHLGVSNQQLIKEESPIASLYKNQSVAEQNSVDIAWWLLMTPNFADLRTAIYGNAAEMQRFRQILVNCVIATDIMDRDMKIHRDKAWKKIFGKGDSPPRDMSVNDRRELQATMVLEHLMQAADHIHTMENFSTYLKWSQRLFDEMYHSYHAGRAEKDPISWWYVGELAFFDKFVIPLATRLKESGAFGSSGDEYLIHALENRKLWATKGKVIVHEMTERYSRKIVSSQEDTVTFSS